MKLKQHKTKVKVPSLKSKAVVELFPRRFPGHRLNVDNTLGGLTPADCVIVERGSFFNKTAYIMKTGWKLRGWATPPYPRGDAVAIVFEKVTPGFDMAGAVIEGPLPDFYTAQQPGIYWIHGNRNMQFII